MFSDDVLAEYGFEKGRDLSDGNTICAGCWDKSDCNRNNDVPEGEPIYWQSASYEYNEYESYCRRCAVRIVHGLQEECDAIWVDQIVAVEQQALSALRCAGGPSESIKWWHEKNGIVQRAHTIDIVVRKDGREYRIESDFLKQVASSLISLEMLEKEDV